MRFGFLFIVLFSLLPTIILAQTEQNHDTYSLEREIKSDSNEFSPINFFYDSLQSVHSKNYHPRILSKFNKKQSISQPIDLQLKAYPNPFNLSTVIQYNIPEAGRVQIDVFNSLGMRIRQLRNEFVEAGNHSVRFDATGLASGIYIFHIQINQLRALKLMILIK
jgi:hypothetical protein